MVGTMSERREYLDRMYPVWTKETLWTRFQKSAEKYPDRPFILSETKSFSYQQTMDESVRLSESLYASGIRAGSHVAVLLENCADFVFLTFAIARLGAVKIPVNAAVSRTELIHVLKQAEAELLITRSMPDPHLQEEVPGLRGIVVHDRNLLYDAKGLMFWKEFLAMGHSASSGTIEKLTSNVQDPDGLCDIMFTSGSTSASKGVMLRHDAVLRSAYANCYTRCFEDGRRVFGPLPLFHAYTYIEGLLAVQYVGGAIIFSELKFNARHALHLLQDQKANDMLLIGSLVLKMLQILRECSEDGAPMRFPDLHAGYWCVSTPDWMWDASGKAFDIQDITTGMGMTELCSSGVITGPESPKEYVKIYDGLPKRAGSAGTPELDGHLLEIRICDPETGADLPAGEEGEIWYRGSVVTPGYYKNQEATVKAYTENDWFRSGDLGRLSDEGYLRFTGRINDMYKINAENVSPLFLDCVIGRCPLVNAVETVGIMCEKYGEVGAAFIDAADKSEEGKAAIKRYCEEHLAGFQVPRYYFFSDSETWARTGTGKISKRGLRQMAQQLLEKG